MDDALKRFGKAINRLIAGESLSRQQSMELFTEILNGTQPDLHQGAFLAAITAKGPSPQEIAGAWQAIFEIDTAKAFPESSKPLVDNCGTGMDAYKTFNISTAAAIVAAAGGVCLARHGARAITSRCGTVDLCEALGVDVECPVETVKTSIEKAGIGLFNGMSAGVHPRALFRILSQIRFGSILNIAASLANPVQPVCGVRGVYAKEMVLPVIRTMQEIGFKKAMVFHGASGNGAGGIDELSPVAESFVAELSPEADIKTYMVSPETAGISKVASIQEIAGGADPREEALRLLRVFNGSGQKALHATICLNAAPVFYVAGDVASLKQGAEKARDCIDSGRAMDQLRQWVQVQNRDAQAGAGQLESLMTEL